MEAKSPLVRSDRTVELYSETVVHLNLSLIVHPRNAKHNYSLRRYKSFKQGIPAILLLIGFDNDTKRLQNFFGCLMKFRLRRILGNHKLQDLVYI